MRSLVVTLMVVAGCKASVGATSVDSPWPPILDANLDYDGAGGGAVGDRIAAFALPDQYGAIADYRQFLGFVTVIEVTALWSPACLDRAETQQAFAEQLQADPVWLMSVLVQDTSRGPPDPADASAWAERFGLAFPVLGDLRQEQQQDWEIAAWPTTLVVGPDGTIAHRHDEAVDEPTLTAEVEALVTAHAGELRTD